MAEFMQTDSENRTIMLIDMNSFFASVEQQSNPALRGKPVLVGGSSSQRSVVAAASYEARVFGIHSGMSMFEALKLCPHAILIGGNHTKYADSSRRIFQIFRDYTDQVEVYSIDECFLDVTATQSIFGGAQEIAKAIKRRIRAKLGLTCSVGIGPNKLLAKFASGMQKPDGLTEIRREDVKALLENLPVEKLHGIGEKMRIRLASIGITTAGSLGRVSMERLKKEFGILGEKLHDMGNGIDNSPVVPYHCEPDAKSMGHSITLSRDTRSMYVICNHLLRLSEKVGRRLRKQGFAGSTVTLVLRYSDMHTFTRRKTLPEYLDDGFDIYQAAISILQQQNLEGRAIRLVGVSVSNLVKGVHQMDMFADPRWRDLQSTVDSINDKYGEFTIKRASLIGMNNEAKSHGFDGKQLSYQFRTHGNAG